MWLQGECTTKFSEKIGDGFGADQTEKALQDAKREALYTAFFRA